VVGGDIGGGGGFGGGLGGLLGGLLVGASGVSLDGLPDVVSGVGRGVGFGDVRIYLGDVERRRLHLLRGMGTPGSAVGAVDIEGSDAGRSYQYGVAVQDGEREGGGKAFWVPLFNGIERMGVLWIECVEECASVGDEGWLLATLVALIIANKRGYSDTYARLNRTQPMNVAAEAQWNLMPPRTYSDSKVTLAATLEPSYQISGDAYDYATAGPMVYLSIFDAMGHDTAAGLTASLAVAAARNARRGGAGISETGEVIEQELSSEFGGVRYVTAILASLDTRSGVLSWCSFGHHPPLILRNGVGLTLWCSPAFPLGTGLRGPRAKLCRYQLHPGDRVVLYTDGITEARRPHGTEFGLDLFISYLTRYYEDRVTVPETVRRFVHAFLDYHDGRLHDDATVLLCEWPGPAPGV
jgi:hypothetical protein